MKTYEEQLNDIQLEKKAWVQTVNRYFETMPTPNWLDGSSIKRGVSVIVASHDSEELLRACLASLEAQTIHASLIEWVLVFNGPNREALRAVSESFGRDVDVVRLEVEEANVSIARNQGIDASTRQYVTFLDEDDTFSPTYVERLFEQALPNRIMIADIQDRSPSGEALPSPLHREFERLTGQDTTYEQMSQLLTLNACKLVPAVYAKQVRYEPTLRSGEDVVYFSTLFSTYTPEVKMLPSGTDAIYYRQVRERSVSRQAVSQNFSVDQRLSVIKRLDAIPTKEASVRRFIERKIDAQTSMMSLFYETVPEQRDHIRTLVREAALRYFSFSILNQHAAERGIVIGERLERIGALMTEFPDDLVIRVYLMEPYTRQELRSHVTDEQFERLTFANMSLPNWSILPEVCYSSGDVRAVGLCTEHHLGVKSYSVPSR
ncbi:glycosyltransferase [Exiguobacterium sp. AT1b]|uniref:glycosyltransferase family 2 protein n=1 Tax=Exiguobacterium sp. (strain ATCC BAA-1283 / AT1b) TaxID=360911 RepID=UPI00093F174E|nr:glycosyltransferase [Exiguobacterium sp. AT1b]